MSHKKHLDLPQKLLIHNDVLRWFRFLIVKFRSLFSRLMDPQIQVQTIQQLCFYGMVITVFLQLFHYKFKIGGLLYYVFSQ